MNKHYGFSLIEAMVVIAIIVILGASGSIIYSKYVMRAQVNEALRLLDEYKTIASGLRVRSGTIAPYYVLFSDSTLTGFVSGTPAGTSAVKTVGSKYVNTVNAYSGTDSNGNAYILIGAVLNHFGNIVSGSDTVYIAGVQNSTSGLFTWTCGASASKSDNVSSDYLPSVCQSSLP